MSRYVAGRPTEVKAKFGSSRIRSAIQNKRNNEVVISKDLGSHDPKKLFEPFPFAVTQDNSTRVLNKLLSPLYDVPYQEQMDSKESFCKNGLRHFARELYKTGSPIRLDVARLPCTVNPIVKSSTREKYRSYDSFSVWKGLDGRTPTAGYFAFPPSKHGDTVAIAPRGTFVIKDSVEELAEVLQGFLTSYENIPICYSLGYEAGWRVFEIRSNKVGEISLKASFSPVGMKLKDLISHRDRFKEYMISECEKKRVNLQSLNFQPTPHFFSTHSQVPIELLHGSKYIEENIGNFRYLIGPETVINSANTDGTELVFKTIEKTIKECFQPDTYSKTLVLDVNCSTGWLSTYLSNSADFVIGVDKYIGFVEEARENADLNGIENIQFLCSDLEIILYRILEKISGDSFDITVICNTDMKEIHNHAIDVLRQCEDIKKIVYISSDLTKPRALQNLFDLCQKGQTNAFVPLIATPVDSLPLTEKCHTVLALERLP